MYVHVALVVLAAGGRGYDCCWGYLGVPRHGSSPVPPAELQERLLVLAMGCFLSDGSQVLLIIPISWRVVFCSLESCANNFVSIPFGFASD